MTLGGYLRELREKAGLSQQGLASRAGLSISIVSQLERDVGGDPRISTLRKLAKVFAVPMHDLIDLVPSEE